MNTRMNLQRIGVDKLKPAKYNPRKDLKPGDLAYEKIKRSLHDFGYVDPVIWNEVTGNIVGGHQRYKVLKAEGVTEIDCVVVHIENPQDEKALNVALNKAVGEWEPKALADLLQDLQLSGYDVGATGFDAAEVDDLFSKVHDKNVKDDDCDIDPETMQPFIQPGDVWTLGRHRMVCGDSTNPEHLQCDHGLDIPDANRAVGILTSINYYRLSAYGIDLLDKQTDRYRAGTSIDDLYALYVFDGRLRNALSPVIEFVEVKFRSCIAYHLANKYGAECYRDRAFFHSWTSGVTGRDMFDVFNEHVDEEIKKQSKKPMVIHHVQKYGGHFPIWVVVELLSLGTLSTLYSLMKREDQIAIAKQFHTGYVYMKSWFAALVEIRNICAHYGRLYNMPLDSVAKLSPKENSYANSRLFTDCLALKYITHDESVWTTFVLTLKAIIEECPKANLKCIGFPDNWENLLQ